MSVQKLDEQELQAEIAKLPKWSLTGGEIVRELSFKDFAHAMVFVNGVAELAEGANHHPDIDIRYNKVRLALVTHDSGGITQNDIELAAAIDETVPE
jgi:4a-hydroxytetrahydrobiopterin dehydratase